MMHAETRNVRAFDITELAQQQVAADVWRNAPTITIAPAFPDDVHTTAEPTIESAAIVQR